MNEEIIFYLQIELNSVYRMERYEILIALNSVSQMKLWKTDVYITRQSVGSRLGLNGENYSQIE